MAAKSKPTLCLLSHHGVALEDFKRHVSGLAVRLLVQPVDYALPFEPGKLELPESELYVVDSFPAARATEAMVGSLRERFPNARLIVLAQRFDEEVTFALLRIGVKGLITYSDAPAQLPKAVELVLGGGFWVPRSVLSRFVDFMLSGASIARDLRLSTELSPREKEVLDALLENLANKEIADRLNISERTVKFHVSNLLQKFGVQRRADLILLCYQSRPNN